MELVDILLELWQRRRLLAVGLLVALFVAFTTVYDFESYVPPKVTKDSLTVGIAQTQLLVDAPNSPIADLRKPFDPLAVRASVYAHLISSAPVRQAIGHQLGIPGSHIITGGPSPVNTTGGSSPSAGERSEQLLGEDQAYRISASPQDGQPLVTIRAQGPDAEAARKLANAAVAALREYVSGRQANQHVPLHDRVEIEQLGEAQGGLINQSASRSVAVATFIAVFIAWCFGIFLIFGLIRGVSQARRWDALEEGGAATAEPSRFDDADEPKLNGHVEVPRRADTRV